MHYNNHKIQIYTNTQKDIKKIINKFPKPFNLEKAPLIRVELHYIDNKKTLLLIDSHHIVMDGVSLDNLISEFQKLYDGKNLDSTPIQYVDYAVWENQFNESDEIKKYEEYWLNKFQHSEFFQLKLPYNNKNAITNTYKGNTISKIIDKNKFEKLNQLAQNLGVTPYILFMSAFFILLYKYTGQDEITVGTPIANRNIKETRNLIGMFVNNMIIKSIINSDDTFQDFLANMNEQILNDLSNQPYPFDILVKKLGISYYNSRNPLFDIMFVYQNEENNTIQIGNNECQLLEIPNKFAKFNLSFEVKPKTNMINIEYCTDLFDKKTIDRFFEHYINILQTIIVNNNIKIKDISIISETEKNKGTTFYIIIPL